MEFLLVLGILLLLMCFLLGKKLFFSADKDETCPQVAKYVKTNKIAYYCCLFLGIVFVMLGLISLLSN